MYPELAIRSCTKAIDRRKLKDQVLPPAFTALLIHQDLLAATRTPKSPSHMPRRRTWTRRNLMRNEDEGGPRVLSRAATFENNCMALPGCCHCCVEKHPLFVTPQNAPLTTSFLSTTALPVIPRKHSVPVRHAHHSSTKIDGSIQ